MNIQNQFYHFYRPYLKKICQTITNGKGIVLVGINAIGKNILAEQVMSDRFRQEFFKNKRLYIVYINLKDKHSPTSNQLYTYFLSQTAKTLDQKFNITMDLNGFHFYTKMSEMIRSVDQDQKIAFVVLDAQNILNQNEEFFKSLIYLHSYSYGKISYILLSEPHILSCSNIYARMFIQYFSNSRYIFLKIFDRKTIMADIARQGRLLKVNFNKFRSLIVRYSGGLHGIIKTFCYILRDNLQIKNIRQLMKIVYQYELFNYWVKEVLDSLPVQSLKILKKISQENKTVNKYRNDIYFRWLVDLGFLKRNGRARYPLMVSFLQSYSFSPSQEKFLQLRLIHNKFEVNNQEIILTKQENLVLLLFYKNKNRVVSYDRIGWILWKDETEKFSLWAISQIVYRLKKKLSLNNINPLILRPVRGKGYMLT